MGFAGALDIANFNLDRARSDFDRGHTFQAVFAYSLPVGRGQRYLPSPGKLVNAVLGGWQLSGTSIMETGLPITIEDSGTNQAIGQSLRPNRIGNGAETSGVDWRGIDYPWFNPPDFPSVPSCASRTSCLPDQYGFLPFSPGNSGRGILDGPGLMNIDLSLAKN
jgi:hypothetical protein